MSNYSTLSQKRYWKLGYPATVENEFVSKCDTKNQSLEEAFRQGFPR